MAKGKITYKINETELTYSEIKKFSDILKSIGHEREIVVKCVSDTVEEVLLLNEIFD